MIHSLSIGTQSYIIKSGDTLRLLAQRYGCTVQEILALNPGITPEHLQVGQTIQWP